MQLAQPVPTGNDWPHCGQPHSSPTKTPSYPRNGGVEARWAHQHQASQAVRLAPHAAHHSIHHDCGCTQAVRHRLQAVGKHLVRAACCCRAAACGCASRAASLAALGLAAAAAALAAAAAATLLLSLGLPLPHADRHRILRPALLPQRKLGSRLHTAQRGSASGNRRHCRLLLLRRTKAAGEALPPGLLLLRAAPCPALLLLAAAGRRTAPMPAPGCPWRALPPLLAAQPAAAGRLQIAPAAAAVHIHPAQRAQLGVAG